MLPTLAHSAVDREISDIAAAARRAHVRRPCEWDPDLFNAEHGPGSVYRAQLATWVCNRCPLATECLLDALALDAAYRRGDDKYGITGIVAGVWFCQENPPIAVRMPAA